jgi:hypothetical protein
MSNNGVLQPQVAPYPQGANNPYSAAKAHTDNSTNKQVAMFKGGKTRRSKKHYRGRARRSKKHYRGRARRTKKHYRRGAKRTRHYRGGAGQLVVPQVKPMYPETGANGQTVQGNTTAGTKLAATNTTNSAYDACLGKGAGCTAAVSAKQ